MTDMIIAATSRFAGRPERFVGIAALLLAAAVLGLSNAVQKSVLADADPWAVMALRASIAVAVLAPLAMGEWRKFAQQQTWPPPVMWLVVASFVFGMGLQNIGANYTTASNLGFLINAYVISMPLLVWATGRGRPKLMACLASVTCFGGAGLLSSGSLSAVGYGDLLCLGAAFAYAIWVLAMSRLGDAALLVTLLTCLQWIPIAVLGFTFTEMSWTGVALHLHANLMLGERLSMVASLGAGLIVCSIIAVAREGAARLEPHP